MFNFFFISLIFYFTFVNLDSVVFTPYYFIFNHKVYIFQTIFLIHWKIKFLFNPLNAG